MAVYLLVDTSASMNYRGAGVETKFTQAAKIAAALAYLMIHQGDKASLTLFAQAVAQYIPPAGTRRHLYQSSAGTGKGAADRARPASTRRCSDCANVFRKRGRIVILSDFLGDLEKVFDALAQFVHRKYEVLAAPGARPRRTDLARCGHGALRGHGNRRNGRGRAGGNPARLPREHGAADRHIATQADRQRIQYSRVDTQRAVSERHRGVPRFPRAKTPGRAADPPRRPTRRHVLPQPPAARRLLAPLVALPFLIHLLNRKFPRRSPFPSIAQIKQSVAQRSRLFRLRHLLLAILRTLAVAAAGADVPQTRAGNVRLQPARTRPPPRRHPLRSFAEHGIPRRRRQRTQARRHRGRKNHQHARPGRSRQRHRRRTQPGAVSAGFFEQPSRNARAFSTTCRRAWAAPISTRPALLAADLLTRGPGRQEVYFVSDFQRAQLGDRRPDAAAGRPRALFFVNVAPNPRPNHAIVGAKIVQPAALAGETVTLEVTRRQLRRRAVSRQSRGAPRRQGRLRDRGRRRAVDDGESRAARPARRTRVAHARDHHARGRSAAGRPLVSHRRSVMEKENVIVVSDENGGQKHAAYFLSTALDPFESRAGSVRAQAAQFRAAFRRGTFGHAQGLPHQPRRARRSGLPVARAVHQRAAAASCISSTGKADAENLALLDKAAGGDARRRCGSRASKPAQQHPRRRAADPARRFQIEIPAAVPRLATRQPRAAAILRILPRRRRPAAATCCSPTRTARPRWPCPTRAWARCSLCNFSVNELASNMARQRAFPGVDPGPRENARRRGKRRERRTRSATRSRPMSGKPRCPTAPCARPPARPSRTDREAGRQPLPHLVRRGGTGHLPARRSRHAVRVGGELSRRTKATCAASIRAMLQERLGAGPSRRISSRASGITKLCTRGGRFSNISRSDCSRCSRWNWACSSSSNVSPHEPDRLRSHHPGGLDRGDRRGALRGDGVRSTSASATRLGWVRNALLAACRLLGRGAGAARAAAAFAPRGAVPTRQEFQRAARRHRQFAQHAPDGRRRRRRRACSSPKTSLHESGLPAAERHDRGAAFSVRRGRASARARTRSTRMKADGTTTNFRPLAPDDARLAAAGRGRAKGWCCSPTGTTWNSPARRRRRSPRARAGCRSTPCPSARRDWCATPRCSITNYQPYCFVKQRAHITASIRVIGCEHENLTVQLLRQNQVVKTTEINAGEQSELPVDFEVSETRPGPVSSTRSASCRCRSETDVKQQQRARRSSTSSTSRFPCCCSKARRTGTRAFSNARSSATTRSRSTPCSNTCPGRRG